MSILKTGLVAASLCLAASLAHADASVPVQGTPVLKQQSQVSSDAGAAFASAPRAAWTRTWTKTWTQTRSNAPFTREAMTRMSGH